MSTRDERDVEQTDRLLDLVHRTDASHVDQGVIWDDLRHHAEAATEDGVIWDDVALAAYALSAEARRPVPADVAERHLAAMHAELGQVAGSRTYRWRQAWRRRVAGAAAAATAFTTLGGGAAVAVAQEAAPGDALYGVKRASEQVRLVLERSPQGDAALHLEFAQRRLEEASQAPGVADELLTAALDHLDVARTQGDEETRQAAEAVGQNAIDTLSALLDGGLPTTASDQARESLERNLARITAHHEAKESGASGRDQAPGQQDGRERGNSGDAPGRTDGDAPGTTDDAGEPDHAGRPDDAGKPDGAGKPEGAGAANGGAPAGPAASED